MENKIVKKEGYTVELEVALTNDEFKGYIAKAYNKDKNKYTVQGFRKGKAPQYLVERIYGKGVFFDTAMDLALNFEYPKAVKDLGLDVVDYPNVDLKDFTDDKGVTFTIKVDVKPEVELGQYKGVEVEIVDTAVTDGDVDEALTKEAEKNSRMISVDDRAVMDKDTVIIDYDGSVDGVKFEGGAATNHELVIGSGSFIPGFEDQIIGHKIGEEFDVSVKFPDEYHEESLKGKAAVFKVNLHEIKIKEIPAVDGEFIKDISEFNSVDEFKADKKKKLEADKQKKAEDTMRNKALMAACENAKADVPKGMTEDATDKIIENMKTEMQYSGYTLEQYMQYTGMKMEDIREQYKEQAQRMVIRNLVIEAVKKAENITVTAEEIEAELKKEAEQYKMEVEEIKKAIGDYKKYYTDKLADEKTVEFIYANSKKVKEIKEKKAKKEAKAPAEEPKAEPKKKAAPKKKAEPVKEV